MSKKLILYKMAQVSILVVVNVAKAVSENSLTNNLWMFDSNRTGTQGSSELITQVKNGDTIVWSVAPIDPDSPIKITSFNSNANAKPNPAAYPTMINPTPISGQDGKVWSAHVNEAAVHAQYSIVFELEGKSLSWDPFITSTNPS